MESQSERAALSKIAMFNHGEIPFMKELGMSPLLCSQGIAGPTCLPALFNKRSGSGHTFRGLSLHRAKRDFPESSTMIEVN